MRGRRDSASDYAAPLRPASADLEVLCRFLAAIAHDLILDDLSLIERAEPGALDRRDVDENILAAALRLNEAIAFGRVEPLH